MSLVDHVHLRVADLEASRRFYRACLGAIGVAPDYDGPDRFAAGEIYIDAADAAASRIHLAFRAEDREAVARFHAAGLAAGGRDNGGPGLRAYGPGYFAAFLLDPNGNNVEAVHHGAEAGGDDAVEPGDGIGP